MSKIDRLVAMYGKTIQKAPRRNDRSLEGEINCSGCNAVCCRVGPNPSTVSRKYDGDDVFNFHNDAGALLPDIDKRDPHRDLHVAEGTLALKRGPDGKGCFWMNETGGCSLHGTPNKPEACKALDCRTDFAALSLLEHAKFVNKAEKLDVTGTRSIYRTSKAALAARRRALKK